MYILLSRRPPAPYRAVKGDAHRRHLHSPLTAHRPPPVPPLVAHRRHLHSPPTAGTSTHRSPLTAHRPPPTAHRPPPTAGTSTHRLPMAPIFYLLSSPAKETLHTLLDCSVGNGALLYYIGLMNDNVMSVTVRTTKRLIVLDIFRNCMRSER